MRPLRARVVLGRPDGFPMDAVMVVRAATGGPWEGVASRNGRLGTYPRAAGDTGRVSSWKVADLRGSAGALLETRGCLAGSILAPAPLWRGRPTRLSQADGVLKGNL